MTSFSNLEMPKLTRQPGLSDLSDQKELKLSMPSQSNDFDSIDSVDDSNLLIISDCDIKDIKLEAFQTVIQYKEQLFINRTLKEVFEKTKFVAFNIRDASSRMYISKNLSNSPFKTLLVYGSSKDEAWIEEINTFMGGKCVKISLKKLKACDALSSEDFVSDLLSKLLTISKPTGKAVKILSALCCGGGKKKA